MIKRKSMMALGGILAVAGCATGGSAVAPVAKPAQSGNQTLTTGRLTISPTLLLHASSSRRKPAFIDAHGDGAGGSVYLQITATSSYPDNLVAVTNVPMPVTTSTAPINVSMQLYGPSGYIQVREYSQPLSTTTTAQLIADSGTYSNYYTITPGAALATISPITMYAVLGGVVISDAPNGVGTNNELVPLYPPTSSPAAYTPTGSFIYAFPADATGGYSALSVSGGFTHPVTLQSVNSSTMRVSPTNISGAFAVCVISPYTSASGSIYLQAEDTLSGAFDYTNWVTVSGTLQGYGGYLQGC